MIFVRIKRGVNFSLEKNFLNIGKIIISNQFFVNRFDPSRKDTLNCCSFNGKFLMKEK